MRMHVAAPTRPGAWAARLSGAPRLSKRRAPSTLARVHPLAALLLLFLAAAPAAAALDDVSADVRKALKLSGQGAAVAVVGVSSSTGQATLLAQGAAGTRRVGYPTAVTPSDAFLVASCGKSMTASLFGALVTQGKVKWTDTIKTVFKKGGVSTAGLNSQLLSATVSHLLSHRAGFSGNDYTDLLPAALTAQLTPGTPANAGLTPRQQRQALSLWQLARKPAQRLGAYSYSNAGYETAAWLAEVAAGPGASFEALLRDLLAAAGINDLVFWYPPAYGWTPYPPSPSGPDPKLPAAPPATPIGHDCDDKTSKLTAQPYDWTAAAPSMYGSGGMGVSVASLAMWVAFHMRGLLGLLPPGSPISTAAFAELHRPWVKPDAPRDGDYAKGWSNDTTADGAPMMSHDGSYGGFETTMFGYLGAGAGGRAAPGTAGRLVAVAASTNLDGGDSRGGRGACAKAVSEVLATLAPALADRYWDA